MADRGPLSTLPAPAPIRLECSWCGVVLRDGDPEYVSHGICGPCAAPLLAAVPTSKGTNR